MWQWMWCDHQFSQNKTNNKMTIADTITNTTFVTNYTSDSNFKL